MSNLQQSDLILAGRYVDGDLPVHEVAAAESRIASDADFAAAVEQIRGQSSLMKGLPTFKPSEDLAERTLQASIDQVKAVVGAWPVESEDKTVAPVSSLPTSSFDWKSTVALAASLAGVFLIGNMLWQNWNGSESNMAMSESSAPPVTADAVPDSTHMKSAGMFAEERVDADEPLEQIAKKESPSKARAKGAVEIGDQVAQRAPVSRNRMPEFALSGTPMKNAPAAPTASDAELAANAVTNTSAPIEQIWCVSQDSSVSKNAVGEILQLNRIEVKIDEQQKGLPTPADAIEAFYVAATPGQMKLAMAQISNTADIEMIQLPRGTDSPIADAIQQQFTQSQSTFGSRIDQQVDSTLPERLQPPAANALAQNLVANPLPRSMPPLGPVPPILKSGMPINGLTEGAASGLAMTPRAKSASRAGVPAPAQTTNDAGGAGLGNGLAESDEEMADVAPAKSQQQSIVKPQQSAEFDKYLDDSDQQLRQYLILVRGGEEKEK